ncbi:MAG: FecR domain-containing protein [Candidatus Hydrogenedentales bacterium]
MASCVQILGLLQAFLDDEIGSVERLLFEDHLHNCDACRHELKIARAANVQLFELLKEDRLQENLVPTVMAHLPEMDRKRSSNSHVIPPSKKRTWNKTFAALVPVLAPIILLVLGGLLWLYWPSIPQKDDDAVGLITYSNGPVRFGRAVDGILNEAKEKTLLVPDSFIKTGKDGRLLLGLSGPSHVSLYEDSSLYLISERKLLLEQGRIFVDVHPDTQEFLINTPHGVISALGTSFEVYTTSDNTEVTVVNGEVLVENETSFALLHQGNKALFSQRNRPKIERDVPAARCLEMARNVLPEVSAQRMFLTRFVPSTQETTRTRRQIFMVETKQRLVRAVELNWLPDPYSEGHAGYSVYVSDSSLNPLFKTHIPPSVFQDKTHTSINIDVPAEVQTHAENRLHIDLLPDYSTGQLDTSFTEVRAVGVRP